MSNQLAEALQRNDIPPPLRQAFEDEFLRAALRPHRIALLIGIFSFVLFQVLDMSMPADVFIRLAWVRLGLIIPTLLVLLAFSFSPWWRTFYDLTSGLSMLLVGVGVMLVQLIVDPLGFPIFITSLIIVIFTSYTLAHLRLRTAGVTGLLVLVIFLAIGWAINANLGSLLFSGVFLAIANLVGWVTAYYTEQYRRRDFLQRKMLELESARSESLLLNILPVPVAQRLKRGELIADSFDEASILFADITNFSAWAATHPPETVLNFLNRVFSAFDDLIAKYQVEKIKTIGDSYMVVSGAPQSCPNHLAVLADMALEMQSTMQTITHEWGEHFQLRIGLHTGPVVAGVIGSKKFIYDLWGDTVNIASRMESLGQPGRIQVTETVYQLLQNDYEFEPRGALFVKGRGDMQTYWLVRRRA